jgi:hypothetical protein
MAESMTVLRAIWNPLVADLPAPMIARAFFHKGMNLAKNVKFFGVDLAIMK